MAFGGDVATLGIRIDTSGADKGKTSLKGVSDAAKGAEKSVGDLGNKSVAAGAAASKSFKGVGLIVAAVAGALQGLASSISVLSELERSMSKLSAVSRATGGEMDAMRKVAKRLGVETEFSTKQAADGMTFLAMAGFSARDAMATIPAVVDLATAASMGLAEAADTASNIMSGFSLSAKEASKATDILTAASTRANTNVSQLGQAMKFVGPVASSLGISMSEAAAAVGVLSDAGIQGGMAGTSLRNILSRLVTPTKDASNALKEMGISLAQVNPATVDLTDIMDLFHEKGMSAAQAMRIFGMEGGPAALAMVAATDRLGDLTDELGNVDGATKETADTMRDNLGGDLDSLQSALMGVITALGDAGLTAVLRGVVKAMTEVLRLTAKLITALSDAADGILVFFGLRDAQEEFGAAAEGATSALEAQGQKIALTKTAMIELTNAAREKLAVTKASMEFEKQQLSRILDRQRAEAQAALGGQQLYEDIVYARDQLLELETVALRAQEMGVDLPGISDAKSRASAVEKQKQVLADLLHEQSKLQQAIENVEYGTPEQHQALADLTSDIAQLGAAIELELSGRIPLATDDLGGLSDEIKEATRSSIALVDLDFAKLVEQYGFAAVKAYDLGKAMNVLAEANFSASIDEQVTSIDAMVSKLSLGIEAQREFALMIRDFEAATGYKEQADILSRMVTFLTTAEATILRSGGGMSDLSVGAGNAASAAGVLAQNILTFYGAIETSDPLGELLSALSSAGNSLRSLIVDADNLAGALSRVGGGMIGAGTRVGQAFSTASRVTGIFVKTATPAINSLKKLGRELVASASGAAKLAKSTSGAGKAIKEAKEEAVDLSDILGKEMATSVDSITSAWGDFVASGFTDFEGFKDAVLNSFKRMISEMVATAASNRILLALGGTIAGGGAAALAGGAVAAQTGNGTGNGILGGLLGNTIGANGLIGGLSSGLGLGVSSLMSGGIGGYIGTLGAQFGSAMTGSLSAIGGLVGALGPLAVGIGILVKGLSQTYAGTAIRGTMGSDGFDGTQFDFYRGGFLRGDRADYSDVDGQVTAILDTAMDAVTDSIRDMGRSLGLSVREIRNFVGDEFTLWVHNLSEAEIMEGLNSEIATVSNAMAELVLGTEEYTRAGEGAMDTLTRLATSLDAANDSARLLGHQMFEASLAGADMASTLVDAFGGASNMASATQAYFQAFYTEAEQTALTTEYLRNEITELGFAMPTTQGQFRALVESIDTTTSAGATLYAQLMSLASAMGSILGGVSPEVSEFVAEGVNMVNEQIAQRKSLAQTLEQSSRLWLQTADKLRDFLVTLRTTDLGGRSRAEILEATAMRYSDIYSAARGGDQGAANDYVGAANQYLGAVFDTASSATDYRRAAIQVERDAQLLAGISEFEGAKDQYMADIYHAQISIFEDMRDLFQSLLTADPKDYESILNEIGLLYGDIVELEGILTDVAAMSYDTIQAALADLMINVNDANVPDYVKDLLDASGTSLEGLVDLIFRDEDMDPGLRFLLAAEANNMITGLDLGIDAFNSGDISIDDLIALSGATLASSVNVSTILGDSVPPGIEDVLNGVGIDPTDILISPNADGTMDVPAWLAIILGGGDLTADGIISPLGVASSVDWVATILSGDAFNSDGVITPEGLEAATDWVSTILNGGAFGVDGIISPVAGVSGVDWLADVIANEGLTGTVTMSASLGDVKGEYLSRLLTGGGFDATLTMLAEIQGGRPGTRLLHLLDAARTNFIEIGGGFEFDPSATLSSWFSGEIGTLDLGMDELGDELTSLGGLIRNLTRQIAAEMVASEQAAQTATQIANWQAHGTTAANRLANQQSTAADIIAEIRALEASTGTTLTNGPNGAAATLTQLANGTIQYIADGRTQGAGDAEFVSQFYGAGGLQSQIGEISSAILSTIGWIDNWSSNIEGVGAVPSFAGGGFTGSGPRSGGLDGQGGFLSMLHPQEHVTDMTKGGGNAGMVRELRALREELRELRTEQRTSSHQITKYTKRTGDTLRKWDNIGQPALQE
jgi:TP901 family phage tail tape measure protein